VAEIESMIKPNCMLEDFLGKSVLFKNIHQPTLNLMELLDKEEP